MNSIGRLFLVLALLLFAVTAGGDQLTLVPCQDAFVCDCVPGVTNPMLGNQYLAQGRYSACYNRTFIQWDLSSIPAGSTIDEVEFRIYCSQFYGSPSGEMAYYVVTEDWNENTVTYNNMPGYTDQGAIFTQDWPSSSSWHSVDITDIALEWYSGSLDNYGLYCHSRYATGTSDCAFYSSRVSNSNYRPGIVVTFTPPSELENSTWGELKTI